MDASERSVAEAAFASGWRIDAIDAVTVASVPEFLPDGLRGWRASMTRI